MTDPEKLAALAERCEAASGPDRELDAEIGSVMRWQPYGPDHWANASDLEFRPTAGGWMRCQRGDDASLAWPAPLYTASLDAAMSLVPDECLAQVWRGLDGEGSATCSPLKRINLPRIFAATPAIALCAAALRALAKESDNANG